MCGIWGYQFPVAAVADRRGFTSRSILVATLMCAMEARGNDSWGVAVRVEEETPEAPGGIAVVKDVGPITKLVDPCLLASCHQVLAHTRKASSGQVCKANAHPFRVKNIVGVHNGSVNNDKALNYQYKRNCDVDSEHIFCHLAAKLPTDELRVYGAAVWIDTTHPDTIQLVRSTTGQLSVFGIGPTGCKVDETVGIAWCSTTAPLEQALALAGYTAFEFSVPPEIRHEINQGVLTKHDAMPFSISGPMTTVETREEPYVFGVYRQHPVFGTSKKCNVQGDKILRWYLDEDEQKIIDKWKAGTLTKMEVPLGDPTATSDGLVSVVRSTPGGQHLGTECDSCGVFQEYDYMAWDTAKQKFICWNCDPSGSERWSGQLGYDS